MRSHEKRRAKLALADEDCQYDGVDFDEAKSLWKNYCGTMEIQWSAHLGQQENRAQDSRTKQAEIEVERRSDSLYLNLSLNLNLLRAGGLFILLGRTSRQSGGFA